PGEIMSAIPLLEPAQPAVLMIDHQAGLAFGFGSTDRQVLLSNMVALAKTAKSFKLPVIARASM
ncbi:hydrolase, partial [Rhizobium ruizarguesonis]